MKNAIEKIDRFLEKYKQLCLEEGIHVDWAQDGLVFGWNVLSSGEYVLQDKLEEIRNNTIDGPMQNDKRWGALDK